jgi:hypothetical protein
MVRKWSTVPISLSYTTPPDTLLNSMPYWIVSQVAARVAQELRCSLGGAVGYSIRFEDVTTKVTRWKKRL